MTDIERGLSASEVEERIQRGEVNTDVGVKTRSIKQIFYENIFTLFNAINAVLAVIVLFTGSYRNMLFMLVIVCNTAIGIFQEIRSKRTTDRLSIIASMDATVIRDGERSEIPLDQIVLDDLVVLRRGDQIPSDAVVVSGSCEVNESLLTGESRLIPKQAGSELMSGSFVNSGSVTAQVVHIGAENYAARISAEAKKYKKVHSEITSSLYRIIKFVSVIIFPVGLVLFLRGYIGRGGELNEVLLSTVAALVGMIPEGLILLTSTVLAVSVVRLARSKVLVQQLYCIETLARVDTLCLDKTGTITTGKMDVFCIEAADGTDPGLVDTVFSSLVAADEDPNVTSQAIIGYYADKDVEVLRPTRAIPFSSEKKWSGASFSDGRSFVMGADRFIMRADDSATGAGRFAEGSAVGALSDKMRSLPEMSRVLLLAEVEGFTVEGAFIGTPRPLGFVAIHDQIRPTAKQTMQYFKDQGVRLKIISGDDPRTVSDIAAKVGVPYAEAYIDATTLGTDEQIANAVERYSVFGRVAPEQKKAFVMALQREGHIVAMTGDGVNDTLALKQSDCSVAMAAGSDAARNVSQLVLVDNDFASMPKVVAEGRRAINNLQRSASLFLVKTLFSMTLAILFILLPWQYPFHPIQMTLISAFTIGIPSFVLALEPNKDRIKGRFLENIIVRALPGALAVVLSIVLANVIGRSALHMDYAQVSTLCVLLTALIGSMLIFRISIPFTPIRAVLLVAVIVGILLGSTVFRSVFSMQLLTPEMALLFAGMALCAIVLFNLFYNFCDRWHVKRLESYV